MRAQRRDANEPAIIAALEAIGATVEPLPGGNGRPDLLVGWRGQLWLIEVKLPGERLNSLQKQWHRAWKGKAHIAYNADHALMIVGALHASVGATPFAASTVTSILG